MVINQYSNKKARGYSLIEVMFIIVIISLMSMYGFSKMKSRQEEQNIKLTVDSLSTWLAAIKNYKMDSSQVWPDNLQAVIDAQFLTSDALCSVWIGNDTGEQSSSCSGKNLYQVALPFQGNTYANIAAFWGVKVAVSTIDIATRIAENLPNSRVFTQSQKNSSDNLIYVAVYQSMPTIISNARTVIQGEEKATYSKIGFITSGGIVEASSSENEGQKIYMPNCPPGFEGHYLQFLANQRTGVWRSSGIGDHTHNNLYYSSKNYSGNDASNAITNPTSNPYINLNSVTFEDHEGSSSSGNKFNYYFTFCIPCGSWHDLGSGQDSGPTQVGGNWDQYNSSC